MDARGATVSTSFASLVLRTDSRQGRSASSSLAPNEASETAPLAPGDYVVRVEAPDAATDEVAVTVKPGETIEIKITLRPR
jgi:hypothetical protein